MYVHLRILETPVKRHKQTRHFSSSGGKRSSGIILHLSSFWQLTVVRGGIIFRKLTPTPLFPSSSLNLWEWRRGFRSSRRVSYLQKKSTHVVRSTYYVDEDFRRKQFSKDERCKQRLAPRKTTLKSSPNSSMSPSSSSFATVMFIMSVGRRVCSTWKTISSIFCERAPLIKYCSWKYPFQKSLFEITNGMYPFSNCGNVRTFRYIFANHHYGVPIFQWVVFPVLVFRSMIGAMVFYGLLLPLHFLESVHEWLQLVWHILT